MTTISLSFAEWVQAFGGIKITTALLDRPTHCYHIRETGKDSQLFKASYEVAMKT
jgi:hypothetical protein